MRGFLCGFFAVILLAAAGYILIDRGIISLERATVETMPENIIADENGGQGQREDSGQAPSIRDSEEEMEPTGTEDIKAVLLQALYEGEQDVSTTVVIPKDEETEDYLMARMEEAIAEIRREYPDIFWLGTGSYGVRWESGGPSSAVRFTVTFPYRFDADGMLAMQQRIDGRIAGIVLESPDDAYEVYRDLHDWIINAASYHVEASESALLPEYDHAYNIDGIFLEGTAVCEGYAKAYKVLCDRFGLPCRVVFGTSNGENHAWNYVQLDGSWYLVDCTADDPVGSWDILRWDYFLRGSDGYSDGQRIGDIYEEDGPFYPTISTEDYAEGQ